MYIQYSRKVWYGTECRGMRSQNRSIGHKTGEQGFFYSVRRSRSKRWWRSKTPSHRTRNARMDARTYARAQNAAVAPKPSFFFFSLSVYCVLLYVVLPTLWLTNADSLIGFFVLLGGWLGELVLTNDNNEKWLFLLSCDRLNFIFDFMFSIGFFFCFFFPPQYCALFLGGWFFFFFFRVWRFVINSAVCPVCPVCGVRCAGLLIWPPLGDDDDGRRRSGIGTGKGQTLL